MDTSFVERKLAAILAADVEGYSRLMHADEDATLEALAACRALVEECVRSWRGHLCGTAGDGTLAEFPSAADAVQAAVAIQAGLVRANEPRPPDRRMQLRIGINLGEVVVLDGDVFGDEVNLAARLEGLAEPGGICVTRAVRDGVRDRLAVSFADLGEVQVKNIARPVHVFRLDFDPTVEVPRPAPTPPEPKADASEAVELAFWASVDAAGRAEEYRVYLDRFPDGSFAPLARARIDAMAEPAPPDTAVELAFWDSVKDSAEPAMLEAYLAKYPDGEFASLAALRLLSLAGRGRGAAIPFRPRSPSLAA